MKPLFVAGVVVFALVCCVGITLGLDIDSSSSTAELSSTELSSTESSTASSSESSTAPSSTAPESSSESSTAPSSTAPSSTAPSSTAPSSTAPSSSSESSTAPSSTAAESSSESSTAPSSTAAESSTAPSSTEAAPESSTAPSSTAAAPESSTAAAPESSTASSSTAAAPESSTVAPASSTVAPASSTVAPASSTVAPASSTAASSSAAPASSSTVSAKSSSSALSASSSSSGSSSAGQQIPPLDFRLLFPETGLRNVCSSQLQATYSQPYTASLLAMFETAVVSLTNTLDVKVTYNGDALRLVNCTSNVTTFCGVDLNVNVDLSSNTNNKPTTVTIPKALSDVMYVCLPNACANTEDTTRIMQFFTTSQIMQAFQNDAQKVAAAYQVTNINITSATICDMPKPRDPTVNTQGAHALLSSGHSVWLLLVLLLAALWRGL